jgi:hypothetical protein
MVDPEAPGAHARGRECFGWHNVGLMLGSIDTDRLQEEGTFFRDYVTG